MADLYISQIKLGEITYDIKDTDARSRISVLESTVTASMHYRGASLTCPTGTTDPEHGYAAAYVVLDGTNVKCYYTGTNPHATSTNINIGGVDYTVTETAELEAGDTFVYGTGEYFFSEEAAAFDKLGDTSRFGAFAYANEGSVKVTPTGSVAIDMDVTKDTVTHTVTQGTVAATGTYTPAGSVVVTTDTATVVKTVNSTTKKFSATSIQSGVTTSKSTLATGTFKQLTGQEHKYMATTSVTPAVDGGNIKGIATNETVSASKVTTSDVPASKLTADGNYQVAQVGTAKSVITGVTAPSSVVDSVTVTGSVATGLTKQSNVVASVENDVLTIANLNFLTDQTGVATTNMTDFISTSTSNITTSAENIIPAATESISIPKYQVTDVTASLVTATDVTASHVTATDDISVAKVGTGITVATGTLDTTSTTNAQVLVGVGSADVSVVTGLTDGTEVVTSATSTETIAGIKADDAGDISVISTVTSENATVLNSASATFTGTEATISVSGTTSGVAVADHTTVVTDVTATATFTGTESTHTVTPA